MNVMTVKLYPKNGQIAFETVSDLPHAPGKFIAGFTSDVEEAKRRVLAYAGGPVEFVEA